MQQQIEAKRASLWPPNAGEDPYFANVSLLLRGDGANGSTTIIDESFSPKTVTVYGNAQISTAQSKYGGSSIYLDGSGDYLSAPADAEFDLGTGDFTIELWVYTLSTTATRGLVSKGIVNSLGSEIWTVEWMSGSTLGFFANSGGSFNLRSTTAFSLNTWYHVAVCRSSGTTKLFVNGASEASSSTSFNVTSGGALYVGTGMYAPTSRSTNSYIDDIRITKGVARYTSNFTPPGAL
jgi:hypothetical protein